MKVMRSWRTYLVVTYDGVVFIASFWLAFLLRFEGAVPYREFIVFGNTVLFVMVIRYSVSLWQGLYSGIFRYASIDDLLKIIKSSLVGTVLMVVFFYFLFRVRGFPRSVFIIDCFLNIIFLGGARFSYRILRDSSVYGLLSGTSKGVKHLTLVVGAGDAGEMIVRDILRQRSGAIRIVGIVDDDPLKYRKSMHNIKVLGKIDDIPILAKKYDISELLIAIPTLSGRRMKCILDLARKANLKCTTLPAVDDLMDGRVRLNMIREIKMDDLIRRETRKIIQDHTLDYIRGKRILVTGAAGSIGKGLVYQLLRHNIQLLVMLDNAETPLFYLEEELRRSGLSSKTFFSIADIRDRERMESVFAQYKPQVVFHAAAYKHVPMMESNPTEAIKANCYGTRNLIHLAHDFEVESFVLISTDKATNPVNMMGASKRLAENYLRAFANNSTTQFVAVRFGNVLGSQGSVVELFKQQINHGGPLTITHHDMRRYFMTIPEASDLVIHSGGTGSSGDILVLEMGTPINIKDLAEEMIRLSGLVPYEDIDIEYTGLRQGEKMEEILVGKGEKLVNTNFEHVQAIRGNNLLLQDMEDVFDRLDGVISTYDTASLVDFVKSIIPEYQPEKVSQSEEPVVVKE